MNERAQGRAKLYFKDKDDARARWDVINSEMRMKARIFWNEQKKEPTKKWRDKGGRNRNRFLAREFISVVISTISVRDCLSSSG
jgi:hypothetical protein